MKRHAHRSIEILPKIEFLVEKKTFSICLPMQHNHNYKTLNGYNCEQRPKLLKCFCKF